MEGHKRDSANWPTFPNALFKRRVEAEIRVQEEDKRPAWGHTNKSEGSSSPVLEEKVFNKKRMKEIRVWQLKKRRHKE